MEPVFGEVEAHTQKKPCPPVERPTYLIVSHKQERAKGRMKDTTKQGNKQKILNVETTESSILASSSKLNQGRVPNASSSSCEHPTARGAQALRKTSQGVSPDTKATSRDSTE